MSQKLHEARFKASMMGLEAGDLIACNRDGKELFTVVLERLEKDGRVFFAISHFSPIVSLNAYPLYVSWDEQNGWLSDRRGGIMLMADEWENTEKDGARTLLAQRLIMKPETQEEKAVAIFNAIRDPSTSMQQAAEIILNKLGLGSPSREEVKLLNFAFRCVEKRVWMYPKITIREL